jgi:uncharacterized membrane protein YozB (DUF420 family)
MVAISTGEHFRVPHSFIGIVTIVFALITVRLGMAQFRPDADKERLSVLHKKIGRITIVIMLINIISGFYFAMFFD